MENLTSFKQLVQSHIDRHGYHITIVGGGIQPRFAYSIGLYTQFKFELIFSGGIYYSKDELLSIFRIAIDDISLRGTNMNTRVTNTNIGEFSFVRVDPSWTKVMLLGALDFYEKDDIPAFQIVPDSNHFTFDIPDMSKTRDSSREPAWRWLDQKWQFDAPEKSQVTTNLNALKGEPITEIMRWENAEWEMFAGPGPEVKKEDMRVVSLGTILSIDSSLLRVIDLEIGKGLWRNDKQSQWHDWK